MTKLWQKHSSWKRNTYTTQRADFFSLSSYYHIIAVLNISPAHNLHMLRIWSNERRERERGSEREMKCKCMTMEKLKCSHLSNESDWENDVYHSHSLTVYIIFIHMDFILSSSTQAFSTNGATKRLITILLACFPACIANECIKYLTTPPTIVISAKQQH